MSTTLLPITSTNIYSKTHYFSSIPGIVPEVLVDLHEALAAGPKSVRGGSMNLTSKSYIYYL